MFSAVFEGGPKEGGAKHGNVLEMDDEWKGNMVVGIENKTSVMVHKDGSTWDRTLVLPIADTFIKQLATKRREGSYYWDEKNNIVD